MKRRCRAWVSLRHYSDPGRCEKEIVSDGLCQHHLRMIQEGKKVVRFTEAGAK